MTESDLEHFQSIPWCAQLINDPAMTVFTTFSREIKINGEDALMGYTLKSNNTIPFCLSFHRRPSTEETGIPEVFTLVTIKGGLDGYPNVCHGGIVATLLDEILGVLHVTNKQREIELAQAAGKNVVWPATVTASLNVKYLKPVRTPQTVLLGATMTKEDGKKLFMDAYIKDENGTVLAKADSLFIRMTRAHPLADAKL